jgi:hypothetical protein
MPVASEPSTPGSGGDRTGGITFSADVIVQAVVAVRALELDDEVVLIDALTDRCFRLNPAAADVWRAVQEPKTVGAVAKELAERWAVDEERADEVTKEFLQQLTEARLMASTSRTEEARTE